MFKTEVPGKQTVRASPQTGEDNVNNDMVLHRMGLDSCILMGHVTKNK